MNISPGWERKWQSKDGTVHSIDDMDDGHLMKVLFYVYSLVREAGTTVPLDAPYAENAPDFVRNGYTPKFMNMAPPLYWNVRALLTERGLYH